MIAPNFGSMASPEPVAQNFVLATESPAIAPWEPPTFAAGPSACKPTGLLPLQQGLAQAAAAGSGDLAFGCAAVASIVGTGGKQSSQLEAALNKVGFYPHGKAWEHWQAGEYVLAFGGILASAPWLRGSNVEAAATRMTRIVNSPEAHGVQHQLQEFLIRLTGTGKDRTGPLMAKIKDVQIAETSHGGVRVNLSGEGAEQSYTVIPGKVYTFWNYVGEVIAKFKRIAADPVRAD